ncbi:MAG TPA: PKD domain-containing protein, partial [Longimicrobium sp.]|nr:PKD domain-containing protein [Longimicrobium sp.]
FADADDDEWTASVDYGDGSGTAALALSGKAFSLAHVYGGAGAFTVAVTVSDNDGGSGTGTAQVTVLTPQQGIHALAAMAAGAGQNPSIHALNATLNAAADALDRGNATAAVQQMGAFVNQVAAMLRSRQVGEADAQALTAYAGRILRSINR